MVNTAAEVDCSTPVAAVQHRIEVRKRRQIGHGSIAVCGAPAFALGDGIWHVRVLLISVGKILRGIMLTGHAHV